LYINKVVKLVCTINVTPYNDLNMIRRSDKLVL